MLLRGNDDELPEGWGDAFDNKAGRGEKRKSGGGEDSDVDMEVTFMPGLSETKYPGDENTLERYQRKMKEKRRKKRRRLRRQQRSMTACRRRNPPSRVSMTSSSAWRATVSAKKMMKIHLLSLGNINLKRPTE